MTLHKTNSATLVPDDVDGLRARSLAKVAFLATLMAGAFVAGIYLLADVVGEDLISRPEFGSQPASEVELWAVVGATAIGGIVGFVIATVSNALSSRSAEAFFVSCLVGFVAYGVLAFIRAESTNTAIWLNVMHLGAAVPIVGSLTNALKSGG